MGNHEMPKIPGGNNYLEAFRLAQEQLEMMPRPSIPREDGNDQTSGKRLQPDIVSCAHLISPREADGYARYVMQSLGEEEAVELAKRQLTNMVIEKEKDELIKSLIAGGYVHLELREYDGAWRVDLTIAALKPNEVLNDELGLARSFRKP